MNNHCEKMGFKVEKSKDLYVVLFISRNKDNLLIPNFKERKKNFITSKNPEELITEFNHFVEDGLKGETSRLYYSVNSRNPERIKKNLMKFLIESDDSDLTNIESKIASIAAKIECADTKHWLFDFDINDEKCVNEFVIDINEIDLSLTPIVHKTPNGYAVVVEHGFDTRQLLEKWNTLVTPKRDSLLCYTWEKKDEI